MPASKDYEKPAIQEIQSNLPAATANFSTNKDDPEPAGDRVRGKKKRPKLAAAPSAATGAQ